MAEWEVEGVAEWNGGGVGDGCGGVRSNRVVEGVRGCRGSLTE